MNRNYTSHSDQYRGHWASRLVRDCAIPTPTENRISFRSRRMVPPTSSALRCRCGHREQSNRFSVEKRTRVATSKIDRHKDRSGISTPSPDQDRSWNKPTNDLYLQSTRDRYDMRYIYIAELEEPNGETRVMTDWDAQNFPVGTFVRATCDSKT